MKTFKVTYKAEVIITNEAFVNAETAEEARAKFDDGKEYSTRRLEESDTESRTQVVSLKEVTKACGCTENGVCQECIPF